MGCDIHAFAEYKDDSKWKMIKNAFKQEYNNSLGDSIDLGRDYELFSLLADVRNDDGIKPLDKQRGIPKDASLGYLAEIEYWDGDGHSHSWFTLKELKNIPKRLLNQKFYDTRLITEKDADGKVVSTCRSTTGKHLGEVGVRKLFGLWDRKPLPKLIEELEKAKSDGVDDENIRVVFFFDN